jgi:DNA-binding winged helix-turn-helix (wHTH) protein
VIYVFGECALDTQRSVLRRAGQVTRLRRKVFQVLTYLVAHPDRVISKQELCEQVWPEQFISDAALESAIKAVRRVIGDSGREQRLIQTVYGQGYRFIGRIESPAAGAVQTHGMQRTRATWSPVPRCLLCPFPLLTSLGEKSSSPTCIAACSRPGTANGKCCLSRGNQALGKRPSSTPL